MVINKATSRVTMLISTTRTLISLLRTSLGPPRRRPEREGGLQGAQADLPRKPAHTLRLLYELLWLGV